jgi:hypothetical protein
VLRLVVRSKLPIAERFEAWVFEEVLPAVLKTGGYLAAAPDESPEAILARAVLVAQDTITRMKNKLAEGVGIQYRPLGGKQSATTLSEHKPGKFYHKFLSAYPTYPYYHFPPCPLAAVCGTHVTLCTRRKGRPVYMVRGGLTWQARQGARAGGNGPGMAGNDRDTPPLAVTDAFP